MSTQKKSKIYPISGTELNSFNNEKTGVTNEAWYETMAAFEHYDSGRSQLFPNTKSVEEIAGSDKVKIQTRIAEGTYIKPYNIVTRNPDELFLYGGNVRSDEGAYVAKINASSLKEEWRVKLKDPQSTSDFNWPGMVGIHGNGQVYAIAGNLLAKINPDTGEHKTIRLPEHEGQGGAIYNGYDVTDDGIIFAKSMEAGLPVIAGSNDGTKSLSNLRSTAKNGVPSFIVAVNPHNLEILASLEAPEPGLGRITCVRSGKTDYIYFLGITRLWRYLYCEGVLKLDPDWFPMNYVDQGGEPGTAIGLLGNWAIFQTNFIASKVPLRVFAVNIWDSTQFHSIQPFPDSKVSYEYSKPALDIENSRVYTNDQAANMVAGLDFDPNSGFKIAWKETQGHMSSFWSIIAGKENRQIIGNDFWATSAKGKKKGDRIIWRDAATGKEIVATKILDKNSNPCIATPGFEGRFYYFATTSQKLVEMTPVAKFPAKK